MDTENRERLATPGGALRLYVDADVQAGAPLALGPDQSHYLAHVMRAKPGAQLRLFNGRDGEWRARISAVSKKGVTLTIEDREAPQKNAPDLWLLLAPIKRTPFDYVVQKATELGVSAIEPVITARTIVGRVNEARLRANAIEAAEQSGRMDVPETRPAIALARRLETWPATRRIVFCDEAGEAPSIAAALGNERRGPWAILTGPEGGFTPDERRLLRAHPAILPVSLGPRIMRADTAALAALAVWQSTLGDWM